MPRQRSIPVLDAVFNQTLYEAMPAETKSLLAESDNFSNFTTELTSLGEAAAIRNSFGKPFNDKELDGLARDFIAQSIDAVRQRNPEYTPNPEAVRSSYKFFRERFNKVRDEAYQLESSSVRERARAFANRVGNTLTPEQFRSLENKQPFMLQPKQVAAAMLRDGVPDDWADALTPFLMDAGEIEKLPEPARERFVKRLQEEHRSVPRGRGSPTGLGDALLGLLEGSGRATVGALGGAARAIEEGGKDKLPEDADFGAKVERALRLAGGMVKGAAQGAVEEGAAGLLRKGQTASSPAVVLSDIKHDIDQEVRDEIAQELQARAASGADLSTVTKEQVARMREKRYKAKLTSTERAILDNPQTAELVLSLVTPMLPAGAAGRAAGRLARKAISETATASTLGKIHHAPEAFKAAGRGSWKQALTGKEPLRELAERLEVASDYGRSAKKATRFAEEDVRALERLTESFNPQQHKLLFDAANGETAALDAINKLPEGHKLRNALRLNRKLAKGTEPIVRELGLDRILEEAEDGTRVVHKMEAKQHYTPHIVGKKLGRQTDELLGELETGTARTNPEFQSAGTRYDAEEWIPDTNIATQWRAYINRIKGKGASAAEGSKVARVLEQEGLTFNVPRAGLTDETLAAQEAAISKARGVPYKALVNKKELEYYRLWTQQPGEALKTAVPIMPADAAEQFQRAVRSGVIPKEEVLKEASIWSKAGEILAEDVIKPYNKIWRQSTLYGNPGKFADELVTPWFTGSIAYGPKYFNPKVHAQAIQISDFARAESWGLLQPGKSGKFAKAAQKLAQKPLDLGGGKQMTVEQAYRAIQKANLEDQFSRLMQTEVKVGSKGPVGELLTGPTQRAYDKTVGLAYVPMQEAANLAQDEARFASFIHEMRAMPDVSERSIDLALNRVSQRMMNLTRMGTTETDKINKFWNFYSWQRTSAAWTFRAMAEHPKAFTNYLQSLRLYHEAHPTPFLTEGNDWLFNALVADDASQPQKLLDTYKEFKKGKKDLTSQNSEHFRFVLRGDPVAWLMGPLAGLGTVLGVKDDGKPEDFVRSLQPWIAPMYATITGLDLTTGLPLSLPQAGIGEIAGDRAKRAGEALSDAVIPPAVEGIEAMRRIAQLNIESDNILGNIPLGLMATANRKTAGADQMFAQYLKSLGLPGWENYPVTGPTLDIGGVKLPHLGTLNVYATNPLQHAERKAARQAQEAQRILEARKRKELRK